MTWMQKLLNDKFEKHDDHIYLNGKFIMGLDCISSFQGEYVYNKSGKLRRINALDILSINLPNILKQLSVGITPTFNFRLTERN